MEESLLPTARESLAVDNNEHRYPPCQMILPFFFFFLALDLLPADQVNGDTFGNRPTNAIRQQHAIKLQSCNFSLLLPFV